MSLEKQKSAIVASTKGCLFKDTRTLEFDIDFDPTISNTADTSATEREDGRMTRASSKSRLTQLETLVRTNRAELFLFVSPFENALRASTKPIQMS